jgi:hypothetical protein
MFHQDKSNTNLRIGSVISYTGIILLAAGLVIMLYYEKDTLGIILMCLGIFDALTGWFITNRHHTHKGVDGYSKVSDTDQQ